MTSCLFFPSPKIGFEYGRQGAHSVKGSVDLYSEYFRTIIQLGSWD